MKRWFTKAKLGVDKQILTFVRGNCRIHVMIYPGSKIPEILQNYFLNQWCTTVHPTPARATSDPRQGSHVAPTYRLYNVCFKQILAYFSFQVKSKSKTLISSIMAHSKQAREKCILALFIVCACLHKSICACDM